MTTMEEDSTDEREKDVTSCDEGTTEDVTDETSQIDDKNNDDDDDDDDAMNRTKNGDSDDESEESDDSESEESDTLDEVEAEDRRQRYMKDMTDLEKQFADLKEQLYKERITQIDDQLSKVEQMEAKEYTGPLKQLEQDCEVRTEVAGFLKRYKMINLENQLQCELQSAEQHFQNEERDLTNTLLKEFEAKLRKVEEERHTAEMYSDLWCDDSYRNRKRRKGMELFIPEKRKKPITVSGPYIVYMLNEMDILEDWAAIRKAKCELARRKTSELSSDKEDPYVTARYEDGKFFYKGEWFQKGEKVILDNRIDFPVHATITAINTGEVWVSKRDGVKCKLYIGQFQKGKYIMSRAPEEKGL